MSTAYRIATDVPWDDPDNPPDWGKRLDRPAEVVAVLMTRAKKHRGGGFRLRERGEGKWGPERRYRELDDRVLGKLRRMPKGGLLVIASSETGVRWLIRKIEGPKVPLSTVGDSDVDFNHGLIFRASKFAAIESWGIRNDRYISGTSIPSAHWARRDSAGATCEARAEDFGGAPLSLLWDAGREIASNGHCGKMLLAGHEWLPGWSSFRFVGSYIGHYDHLHAESRDVTGYLC